MASPPASFSSFVVKLPTGLAHGFRQCVDRADASVGGDAAPMRVVKLNYLDPGPGIEPGLCGSEPHVLPLDEPGRVLFVVLVPPEGVAPPRDCLKGRCSATELRRRNHRCVNARIEERRSRRRWQIALPGRQGGKRGAAPGFRARRMRLKRNIIFTVGHPGIEPRRPS